MRPNNHNRLLAILIVAFALRLVVGLAQDHRLGYENGGGDTTWYLVNGYALAAGLDNDTVSGYGTDVHPDGFPVKLRNLPTPPLYLLFVGIPQTVLPRESAIILIRIVQALLGTITCYLVWRLGRTLTDDDRVGLVAAGALAMAPAFIMEAAHLATETLYIFLLVLALTLYIERQSLKWLGLVGLLLGLATLTRAVLLLFPLGLALHLLLVHGPRAGWRRVALLLTIYTLTVGSWTVYNLARWDRLVIGGEGFAATLFIGATDEGWQGPDATDETLGIDGELPPEPDDQQAVYLENAQKLIGADLVAYVQRRVRQLASAYLQPHGTLFFSGASLRDLALDWLRADRSLAGLLGLTGAESFWPKLALYVFHYTALLAGLAGLWLTRRRWRQALPLIGFILYTTLLHLVLDVIPRYIFPTEVFWWLFASVTLVAVFDRLRQPQRQKRIVTEG